MKTIHKINVETEAGGYFVSVKRWWRGADGRVNFSVRRYHARPFWGKHLIAKLVESSPIRLEAFDKCMR